MFDPAPQHTSPAVDAPAPVNPEITILKKAKALIEDKSNWCVGISMVPLGAGKVAYCAIGAVLAAANLSTSAGSAGMWRLNQIARKMGYWDAVSVNDKRGHAATMRMFDLAIAAAEREVV